MKKLTEKEREKLLAAGERCYREMLREIEQISLEDTPVNYDQERIRNAEAEAWRELRRAERRVRNKRLVMVAACLLLVLTVVMLTGKPSLAYQKLFNKIFFKDNGNSVSISSSSTALVPDNWSGCYLPMEIPPGYVIESAEQDEFGQTIFYINAEGDYIDFSTSIGDFNVRLDTEDCVIENITVNDKEGILRSKYKDNEIAYKSIDWIENDVFFGLSANNLSSETLLSIAESIMIAE